MRYITLALVVGVLSGCSGYSGVKLGPDATIPPAANGGVPITLSRPEFVVKKIEGSDPEQYQISVSYVPDPDQRYAIRLSPALLSSIDLSLAFNETGGLTTSTATIKDQIAPATLALFKVAASAAMAAGTGIPVAFSVKQETTLPGCLKPSNAAGVGARTVCALRVLKAQFPQVCPPQSEAPEGLIGRLSEHVGADEKDKGDPLKTLFAKDETERACLDKLVEQLTTTVTNDPSLQIEKLQENFKTHLGTQASTGTPPMTPLVRNALSETLVKAIGSGDVATLKRYYYVAADPGPSAERFAKLLGSGTAPAPDDPARLVAALTATKLKADPMDQAGLDRVQRTAEARKIIAGTNDALALSPAAWRGRYIAAIQKQIERAERAALITDPSANVRLSPPVLALRRQLAALAGARGEFDRLIQYEVLLDRMPGQLSSGQRLSPAVEYESLRAQAAALDQQIAAAIAAKLTSETKPKKTETLPPRTPWVAARCIDASKSEAWRYRLGEDAPEFVVVLRRTDGTPLEPVKGSETCSA